MRVERAPGVRVEVPGTDGAAAYAPRSRLRAASTAHEPVCAWTDRTSAAFVSLNAHSRDFFGLPELTRAMAAPARERTSRLGAGVPM